MSSASDFVIENGVLTKYTGPGGDGSSLTVFDPNYIIEARLMG